MLRNIEEKSERQRALWERNRQSNEERWNPEFLTLEECAQEMKVSRGTARKLLAHESGVQKWRTPGSRRPIIRVPREVFERVLRRSTNP